MGVVSCKLLRPTSGQYDNRNRGSYNVQYRFEADTTMGVRTAANGCLAANLPTNAPDGSTNQPIPNFGASYDYGSQIVSGEAESTSYARSYSVVFDTNHRNRGTITVQFAPLDDGESLRDRQAYTGGTVPSVGDIGGDPAGSTAAAGSGVIEPGLRGPTFYWDEEVYTDVVDQDKDGDPIVNAANKSFDRPPTIEKTRGVLVAEFKVRTLREVILLNRTYAGAVNASAWTVFAGTGFTNPPARSVVCRYARGGRPVHEGGLSYYPVQMAFAFQEDGKTWDLQILNEGYGYLDAAGGDFIKAVDNNGAPVAEPVLLAADGTKLADTATGNMLTFRVRREVNFNNNPLNGYLKPS